MTQRAAPRALVTGGARRLGRAMGAALAARGYDVAVHYNSSAAEAVKAVDAFVGLGRKAVAIQADLLDLDACEALVPRAAEALGGALTLLVNNASIFEHDSLASATRNSWDRHMGSNLRAPFILTQTFAAQAPAALTDAEGEIEAQSQVINIIDQRVLKPTPEFMTYGIAKAGLWAFTRMAAQGLAPAIRVNAIGPGPTLRGGRQNAAHFRRQRQATILKRGADPDGIVAALEYLVSAKAVTGQLLCVDGGQHLAWRTPDVVGNE